MAEFDPFAKESRKLDVVVMDPHDPNKASFAAEPALAGGFTAERQPDLTEFATRSSGRSVAIGIPSTGSGPSTNNFSNQRLREALDSRNLLGSAERWSNNSPRSFPSKRKTVASHKEPTTWTRPRDSGGIALSFSGVLPGNERENVNNISRFIDNTSLNTIVHFNASAFNISAHGGKIPALLSDNDSTNAFTEMAANQTVDQGASSTGNKFGGISGWLASEVDFGPNALNISYNSSADSNALHSSFQSTSVTSDNSFSNFSLFDKTFSDYSNITSEINGTDQTQHNSPYFQNAIHDIAFSDAENISEPFTSNLNETTSLDLTFSVSPRNMDNDNITITQHDLSESIANSTDETSHVNISYSNSGSYRDAKIMNIPSFDAPGLGSEVVESSFSVPTNHTNKILAESGSNMYNINNFNNDITDKITTLNLMYDSPGSGTRLPLTNTVGQDTNAASTYPSEYTRDLHKANNDALEFKTSENTASWSGNTPTAGIVF